MKFTAQRAILDFTGLGFPELVIVLRVVEGKRYARSLVDPECDWRLMLVEFRRLKKFFMEES